MLNPKKVKRTINAVTSIIPVIIVVGVVCLLPIIYNIYLSFTNFSIYRYLNYTFIGLKNYYRIFGKYIGSLGKLMGWTFTYSIFVLVISFLVGTGLAILLNKKNFKLKKFYRTFLIIPWAVPAFITLLVWRGLLNYNFGAINSLLSLFKIDKIPWLVEPGWARFAVIMVAIWYGFPYMMVVALGVLQSIPESLYEAAAIDGASGFFLFRKITLPLLIKPMLPVLILNFIMNFNNFGIYLLTEGGPAMGSARNPGATDLLITYIFRLAFTIKKYGLAAAYAVLIFIFLAAFYLINIKISEKHLGDL